MHLKLLPLFVVVLYFTLEVSSIDFKYKNTQCSYYEKRKNGPGPRTLQINCPKLKNPEHECSYTGNPHGCKWYNKKNQPKFYEKLVEELVKNGKLCVQESVEYARRCPGYKFTLDEKQMFDDIVFIEPEGDLYIEEEDLEFRPYV